MQENIKTKADLFEPPALTPEGELWAAVIMTAVQDLHDKRSTREKERKRRSAAHYLFESRAEGVGSLKWVCDNFGICSAYIRKMAAKRGVVDSKRHLVQKG
ncbi:MAG: hypothetical protein RBT11_18945 [Desulfobacterales bacterium]|jgi:hypothetical protein|nr:hypothetical protein [Desulfobacterales bacterium]